MKIAFLILAHKNPAQLQRLITALEHPAFHFYIHLDKKVDEKPFLTLLDKSNVFFIKNRVDVRWAAYSLVQAQLNGMEGIAAAQEYDYITVVSGQDFPIKSTEYIYRFFCENKGTEFISCVDEKMDPEWWDTAKRRVAKYHLEHWSIPGKYRIQNFINSITPLRKYPLPHIIVGRSQWFSISGDAARYMVSFIKQHPQVVRFFKYVWGADEFIFSTVLYNSFFKNRIKTDLFYIDWSENKPNPKLLVKKDFEALYHSDKLFARKFDMDVDAEIITMLEELITANKNIA